MSTSDMITITSLDKYLPSRWWTLPLLLLIGVMTASCNSIRGEQLIYSHTSYNDAVQLAVTREVLTNIVRSRYSDPMQFITVQSINAQFSVNAGVSAGASDIGGSSAVGDTGASVGYSESPTITFAPEFGNKYFESLYGPLAVEELVAFVITSRHVPGDMEWESLSLSMLFASVNGASDSIGSEINELYSRRIRAIAYLLDTGSFLQQVAEWDKHTSAIAKSKVLGEDMVEAGKAGLYWLDEDEGLNARLAKPRLALSLQLVGNEDPATVASLHELGLEPGINRYFVRSPVDAKPGADYPNSIWVTPRSMVEIIMVAGSFVDVPAEHSELVPERIQMVTSQADKHVFRIRSSRDCRNSPYSVKHRGFCFYVDDTDSSSKQVLEGMVSTYVSRLGGVSGRATKPQVVIPVG